MALINFKTTKVSASYKFAETLSDSEESEDYDNDPFYQQTSKQYFAAKDRQKLDLIRQLRAEETKDNPQADPELAEADSPEKAEPEIKPEDDLMDESDQDVDMRQNEIKFVCDSTEATLSSFIDNKLRQEQVCKLRTEIENWVRETHKLAGGWTRPQDTYGIYFNYGLNTQTWRNFVNKQIL